MSFAHLLDRRRGAVGAIALGMAIAASPAYAKEVTWDDIVNDAETPENVLMYGFGPKAQRFSPMDHINADNVERLRPAWQFSFGDEKQRGQETQPVVFDGKIYLTASYSRMFALDSATGEKIWDYSHRLPDDIRPCCDVVNRGPAIYGDKLFFGTLDANLVALNKDSGEVVWNENFDDHKAGYTMTGAPTIIKDQKTGKIMLIHGNSGDEFGALGKLYARNPDTGEELWMRPLVEGHVGRKGGEQSTPTGDPEAPSWPDGDYNDTGKAEAWSHGGGAPWQSASFDVSTNTIIIGAGNPAPWNTWARTGESGNPRDYESLYTSGQAYVEPSTGELVGFYQHTPNDAWDFSGNNEIILFDFEKDGKTMQAGAHADRNGYFFLTDTQKLAERGGEINKPTALLAAYPFVDNITWTDGYNLETGKPNEVEGQRPPQIKEGEDRGESIQVSPPFLGGKNWNPMSYSPDTGLFYIPANNWTEDYWTENVQYKKGAAYLGQGFRIHKMYDDHVGTLRAMDPATGEIVWKHNEKLPLWAGTMATAGNLVFTGTSDGYFKAFNAETGEELWRYNTGSGVVGVPITWEQDGEQYVGIATGYGGAVPLWGGDLADLTKPVSQGGSFIAFKIPDWAQEG